MPSPLRAFCRYIPRQRRTSLLSFFRHTPPSCFGSCPLQDLTPESVVKLVDQLKAGGTPSIPKKGSLIRDKAEPFGAALSSLAVSKVLFSSSPGSVRDRVSARAGGSNRSRRGGLRPVFACLLHGLCRRWAADPHHAAAGTVLPGAQGAPAAAAPSPASTAAAAASEVERLAKTAWPTISSAGKRLGETTRLWRSRDQSREQFPSLTHVSTDYFLANCSAPVFCAA